MNFKCRLIDSVDYSSYELYAWLYDVLFLVDQRSRKNTSTMI